MLCSFRPVARKEGGGGGGGKVLVVGSGKWWACECGDGDQGEWSVSLRGTYGAFAQPCGLALGIGELEGRRKAKNQGDNAAGGGRHGAVENRQSKNLEVAEIEKTSALKCVKSEIQCKKNACKLTGVVALLVTQIALCCEFLPCFFCLVE